MTLISAVRKEAPTATYITLLRYTQKGVENIKESPKRLDAAKQAFRSLGAEIKAFYLVTGQYDAAVIPETPDDATIAQAALATASSGNVRTESFRAFTEDEYRKVIATLP